VASLCKYAGDGAGGGALKCQSGTVLNADTSLRVLILNGFQSFSRFSRFSAFLGLRVFVVGLRTPFTGGAEGAVGTLDRTL
jgi:hypothetical protein